MSYGNRRLEKEPPIKPRKKPKEDKFKVCPTCGGGGWIEEPNTPKDNDTEVLEWITLDCPECWGLGEVSTEN